MPDFIELIKEKAIKSPSKIAVTDGERKISYGDLFKLVSSISNGLLSQSQAPRVVLDLKQGVEAYALIIAVLYAGGVYCPLSPEAPIGRKMQIIGEFKPDFVVVEPDKIPEFSSENAVTIEHLCKDANLSEVVKTYDPESTIYVIYTSGSTGMSKGVMVSRKALNKFLEWSIPTYAASEGDIWGQYSFLSFDLSIVDIFTCLCSGATLLAMNDIPAKKNRPAGIIEKEKITVWHSIPSAVEFMMVNERARKYDFSSLRVMSFCGEALRKHQVEFLFNKKNDLLIFNTYGPTEGTLFCTWQELKSNNYLGFCDFTMSIGKAIPGWNLKLNTVEGFTEKEIIIYGDYIGQGYLGNGLNTKFGKMQIGDDVVNSFETGDLITEKNGNLYFSCRKDRQVQLKGFRIELDEIDFRINEFLKMTSVTIVKNDSLYSFIETEEKIQGAELRGFLKTKLEAFKIPNAFYPLKEIPRNQNQKVDINALLELIP
ncbi:MAG: hypothetical protein EOP04_08400 [Proteobacteria bacterium]|nr:MAG: hypothetical protein EOP04_08400 [Pseudomonadota bacterium]